MRIFPCMGKIFCGETFEIPHKISYPYIEKKTIFFKVEILRALRFNSLRPSDAYMRR